MTTPPITKEIVYDRESHDYAAYVTIDEGPQLIGFRKTWHDAEMLCNDYAYNYYTDNHTPEVAAAIAVEIGGEEPQTCPDCTPGHPCYDHEPTWAKRWIVDPASPGGA